MLKKKVKKTSRKTLVRKADELFRRLILSRGSCQSCGSKQYLQTAHIITRKYYCLRFDLNNALCLCAVCHRNFHDSPIEFGRWLSWNVKKEVLDGLLEKKSNVKPMKNHEIEAIIHGLGTLVELSKEKEG